jgi:hypothetical protein
VDEHYPLASRPVREERVRALGIDPHLLSPEEQVELIDIHASCPNERLDALERMEA